MSGGPQYASAPRDRGDSLSSNSPFHDDNSPSPSYPPHTRPLLPQQMTGSSSGTHVHIAENPLAPSYGQYDAERAQTYPMDRRGKTMPMPTPGGEGGGSADFGSGHGRGQSRNASWDLLAGMRKFEQGYEQFDSRNASQAHLAFADGDIPKNKVRTSQACWSCDEERTSGGGNGGDDGAVAGY